MELQKLKLSGTTVENFASVNDNFTAVDTSITSIEQSITTLEGNVSSVSGNIGDGDITVTLGSEQIGAFSVNTKDDKTIQISNDLSKYDNSVSKFITNAVNDLTNYYSKSEINGLVGGITSLHFEVVDTLPATGQANIIYLIPSANSKTQNIKDEFVWVNNAWEQIGSTEVDLSDYLQKNTAITGATKTKITYDSKGLVTGGADATLDDIADGATRKLSNYVEKNAAISGATKTKIKFDSKGLVTEGSDATLDDILDGATRKWSTVESKYNKPSTGIPKSDLASAVQESLNKADSALQSAPVNSVNSKTGAVVLTASDVGALPNTTVVPKVYVKTINTSDAAWSGLVDGFYTYTITDSAIAGLYPIAAYKNNGSTGVQQIMAALAKSADTTAQVIVDAKFAGKVVFIG